MNLFGQNKVRNISNLFEIHEQQKSESLEAEATRKWYSTRRYKTVWDYGLHVLHTNYEELI